VRRRPTKARVLTALRASMALATIAAALAMALAAALGLTIWLLAQAIHHAANG
jgi:hypothetical protein